MGTPKTIVFQTDPPRTIQAFRKRDFGNTWPHAATGHATLSGRTPRMNLLQWGTFYGRIVGKIQIFLNMSKMDILYFGLVSKKVLSF